MKYLLVFLFWLLFAILDFSITSVNILPDASNEGNPLVQYIYLKYGALGYSVSAGIYTTVIIILFLCATFIDVYNYRIEEIKLKKWTKIAVLFAFSMIIFAGAMHYNGFLSWIYGHYQVLDWNQLLRLTAISAPLAFLIGYSIGKKSNDSFINAKS